MKIEAHFSNEPMLQHSRQASADISQFNNLSTEPHMVQRVCVCEERDRLTLGVP